MQQPEARTIECKACGFENPAGMRFCGQCGMALPVLCPACGIQNPPGFKFCGQCGGLLKETEWPVGLSEAVAEAGEEAPLPDTREAVATPVAEEKRRELQERPVAERALEDLMDIIEIVEEPAPAPPLEDLIEIVEEEAQELAEDVVEDLIREQAPAHLTCGVCGMANPPDATHCELCGAVVAPVGAPCPACGFPNKAGSLFCDDCGERLGLVNLL